MTRSTANPVSKRKGIYTKQLVFVWVCIIPVTLVFLAFSYLPILNTLYGSLNNWNALSGRMTFVGIKNYVDLLTDDLRIGLIFRNTLYLTIGSVSVKTVIALLLALCVNSIIKGRDFFRMVFFIPSICSMLATSFVFRFLFQPDLGTINGYLYSLGFSTVPGWLQSPTTAMITVIIFTIWKDLGYVFLILLAGLQGIPIDVIEAGIIDGAGAFKRAWSIILPLLRPVTAYVVATQIIGSLQIYTSIVGLTTSTQVTGSAGIGGPAYSTTTAAVYIYQKAFGDYLFGYGSAIALLLFLVIMFFTIIQLKLQKSTEDF